jgi:hypothetical protein
MKRIASHLPLAGIVLAASLVLAPLTSSPAAAAPAASAADMMRALAAQSAAPVEQVHWRRHWHRRHCGWVRSCWHGRWGHRHCRPVYRCWR